jgi:hypothetical protein
MNSFQIPPGVSSFYQGFWNDETHSFEKGSDIDVFNECLKSCGNDSDCTHKNCLVMNKYCRDNCYLYPESFNTMNNCARDNTCGRYPNFNQKCIKDKRDTLINCCKRYCNTNLTNCDKDCEGFYNLLLNGKKQDVISSTNDNTPENKVENNYTTIFLICIFFVTILILIKMKKRNK